jgi:hypothetical protein
LFHFRKSGDPDLLGGDLAELPHRHFSSFSQRHRDGHWKRHDPGSDNDERPTEHFA